MIDESKAVLGGRLPNPGGTRVEEIRGKGTFIDALKSFTLQVDQKAKEADKVTQEFAVGKRYDLHEIMIATEKADVSLRLLLQIRNKLLEAYQEVMRMQF